MQTEIIEAPETEREETGIKIRLGYELIYDCPQPTPMILTLNVHSTRDQDIIVPDALTTHPFVPLSAYRDSFGNRCTRLVAPPGRIKISSTGVVKDSGGQCFSCHTSQKEHDYVFSTLRD